MAKANPTPEAPEWIREHLQNAGHSINSLAEETGIPYSTLRRKLRTPLTLTMADLLAVADALGTNPMALMALAANPEASAA